MELDDNILSKSRNKLVDLSGWPSSRIVRVSRASGGKDRHSKVLTSKGLRDRRVRLSVNTAIQFYDLQDRLGYDQPSKAVEWLLNAAASSIQELPPINNVFSQENRPSGTSEGSGLSLSRSESMIKGRDKEKESSLTQLLSVGLNNIIHSDHNTTPTGQIGSRQWSSAPMDYFPNGLIGPPVLAADHHQEIQHFSYVPDSLVSFAVQKRDNNKSHLNGVGEFNSLNFIPPNSLGPGGFKFNRGTLQSNSTSPSVVPHIDGPPSFFIGTLAPMENHSQFLSGLDSRHGNDNGMQSGHRGKEKK